MNKVITSAVKQSIKAYHPKLNEALKFKDFIASVSSTHKFIAHCINTEKFSLKDKIILNSDYLVVIGPEGDFSQMELDFATDAGFLPIALGSSRLRTETAALEACFEVNFLNR